MTVTYNPREAKRKDGELISYQVAGSTKIPKGVMVNLNLYGCAVNASDTANQKFIGVSYESVDNSAGSDGRKSIRVYKTGTFVFKNTGGMQTDLGEEFYIADNQTLSKSATTNAIKAGRCVENISSTETRIRIDGYTN